MIFLLLICGIIISLPFVYTTVVLKYEKNFQIEIRFGPITLCLTKINENKNGEKEPVNAFSIIKNVISTLDKTEVEVKRLFLRLPTRRENFSPFTLPFGYSVALGTLLVYLDEHSAKLTVADDAFITDPDSEDIALIDVSLKTRLYNLVIAYMKIRRDKKRTDARKEKANVGN